jgi:uncharacterized protein YcnI
MMLYNLAADHKDKPMFPFRQLCREHGFGPWDEIEQERSG